jgi:hypothetical protein
VADEGASRPRMGIAPQVRCEPPGASVSAGSVRPGRCDAVPRASAARLRTTFNPGAASGRVTSSGLSGAPYPCPVKIAVDASSGRSSAGSLGMRPTTGVPERAGRIAAFGGSAWVATSGEVPTMVSSGVNVGFAPESSLSTGLMAARGRPRRRIADCRTVRPRRLSTDRHWTAATNTDKLANRCDDRIRGSGT